VEISRPDALPVANQYKRRPLDLIFSSMTNRTPEGRDVAPFMSVSDVSIRIDQNSSSSSVTFVVLLVGMCGVVILFQFVF